MPKFSLLADMRARPVGIAIVILLLGRVATPLLAETRHVPSEYPTIQFAIIAAVDGDVVEVAPGTYRETLDFAGKAIRVVAPEGAVIDGEGSAPCVAFQSGEGRDSVLEGFELTNGVGRTHGSSTCGGGIFCVDASPTILRNRIHGNEARRGGGVYFEGDADPRFLENVVEDNLAREYGGGLAAVSGSRAIVESNSIRANQSSGRLIGGGGGVALVACSAYLRGNEIAGNESASFGGGAWLTESTVHLEGDAFIGNRAVTDSGGGLACVDSSGSMAGVRIEENEAPPAGAQLLVGGGVSLERSEFELSDCVVRGNVSRLGGGVGVLPGSYLTMVRCRVEANRADYGGGLYSEGAEVVDVRGGSIVGNRAENWGGGVGAHDTPRLDLLDAMVVGNRARYAGGLVVWGSRGRIRNATIAGNHGSHRGFGSNAHFYGGNTIYVVDNSIIWGAERRNNIDMTNRGGAALTVNHSVVGGGWPGEGNLDVDPLFVSYYYDKDYRLRMDSPCIDRGNDDLEDLGPFDAEGEPRRIDGDLDGIAHVDIGADEADPAIATRFGTVARTSRRSFDVLFLNGSAGDERRDVVVPAWSPVRLEMVPPPEGPDPARFALYAFLAAPDLATVTPQPGGLGVAPFPTPLNRGVPREVAVVWNNLGYEHRLGEADRTSTSAPSVLFDSSRGARAGTTVTFFGIIEDYASTADGPFSRTNAVVLRVVD